MNAPEISWEHGDEKTKSDDEETGGSKGESYVPGAQLGRVQRESGLAWVAG